MGSSKQEFWDGVSSVPCPEKCGKHYQHRLSMIRHMVLVHNYSFERAKEAVDATGIYCPPSYRT